MHPHQPIIQFHLIHLIQHRGHLQVNHKLSFNQPQQSSYLHFDQQYKSHLELLPLYWDPRMVQHKR